MSSEFARGAFTFKKIIKIVYWMSSSEYIFIPFVLEKVMAIENELLDSVANGKPSKSDFVNALVPVCKQFAISAVLAGYVRGRGLSDYLETIVRGFDRSSCSINYIPDGEYKTPAEYRRAWESAWDSIITNGFDYVDRWITYAEMFEQIETQKTRRKVRN